MSAANLREAIRAQAGLMRQVNEFILAHPELSSSHPITSIMLN